MGNSFAVSGPLPLCENPSHQVQRLQISPFLNRRAAVDTAESLVSTRVDSQIDLNPHQVEAMLFVCTSPKTAVDHFP